jgi:hypothetical protein
VRGPGRKIAPFYDESSRKSETCGILKNRRASGGVWGGFRGRINVYEWILCRHLQRSSLQQVETSIRRGRFDGEAAAEKRQALIERLCQLADGLDLNPRSAIRLMRILAAIDERCCAADRQRLIAERQRLNQHLASLIRPPAPKTTGENPS